MAVARNQAAEAADRFARANPALAGRRFTGVAGDGDVRATVNGNGELLDIELAKGSASGSHRARLLGARITEAVGDGRRQAAVESRVLLVSALGGEQAVDDLIDLIDLIGVGGPSVARCTEKETEDNDDCSSGWAPMVSFDELEARVAELNDEFADLRRRAAEARAKLIGEQVAGGTGVVQVNIGGDLVDVRFDLDALWNLNEQRLGPQLVAAIRAAEAKAAQVRDALLAPISLPGREIWP